MSKPSKVSNRGVITSALAGLAALAFAISGGGRGCSKKRPAPIEAVSSFFEAIATQKRLTLFDALCEADRSILEKEARLARDLVGTAGSIKAHDLVRIDESGKLVPVDYELLNASSGEATVSVTFESQHKETYLLRKEGRVWKVCLDLAGQISK